MSSVVISGDTSGAITLAAPAVSGTNTATLPAATGTVMVSGNMPAFSVYFGGSLTAISNNTYTKILYDTEDFDTNNNFASNKFTPTIAGYYQLSWSANLYTAGTGEVATILYKNGSAYKYFNDLNATNCWQTGGSVLVYANGSTDYFEVYCYQNTGSSKNLYPGQSGTWFTGAMVRSA